MLSQPPALDTIPARAARPVLAIEVLFGDITCDQTRTQLVCGAVIATPCNGAHTARRSRTPGLVTRWLGLPQRVGAELDPLRVTRVWRCVSEIFT